MAKRRKLKLPGKCLFCLGSGMSKEHIWPAWIQKIIPKDRYISHSSVNERITKTNTIPHSHSSKQGNLISRKIRRVCHNCNMGWMSRLEQKIEPILTPMIRGQPIALDGEQISLIATWIAKTTVNIEQLFAFPIIRQMDCEFIRVQQGVPPGWQIWVGHMAEMDGNVGADQFATHIAQAPARVLADTSFNVETIMLAIGQLICFVLINYAPDFDLNIKRSPTGAMRRIYPSDANAINWPADVTTNLDEMVYYGGLLRRFAQNSA